MFFLSGSKALFIGAENSVVEKKGSPLVWRILCWLRGGAGL